MLDDRVPISTDKERFEHLLPFFITRQLGADDRAFMQDYVDRHADVAAAVQFAERMRAAVKRIGHARDPEQVLKQISANLQAARRFGAAKTLLKRLLSRCVRFLSYFAILTLLTKGMYYASEKIGWLKVDVESASSYSNTHCGLTLKAGVNAAVLAAMIQQYGGKIVYSSKLLDVEKVFVNVVDKTRLPALIDALMDAGLIDAAAILL